MLFPGHHFDVLVPRCGISIANSQNILPSCAELSIETAKPVLSPHVYGLSWLWALISLFHLHHRNIMASQITGKFLQQLVKINDKKIQSPTLLADKGPVMLHNWLTKGP